jgi:hypothetical protein
MQRKKINNGRVGWGDWQNFKTNKYKDVDSPQ